MTRRLLIGGWIRGKVALVAMAAALLSSAAPLSAEENDEYVEYVDECFDGDCCECEDSCWWCAGTLFHWPGAEPSYENLRSDQINSDQPHIADSAAVVGKGTIQLETDFVYFRDASGGSTVDSFNYPSALLRWGMICDWFELRLAWSYNNEEVFDPALGTFRQEGADDLYIGTKIALAEQHGILPQLAIFPQITVPTGGNLFSGDDVNPGIVIAYGYEITETIGMEINTVFDRVKGDADEFYTEMLQVFNVGWKPCDELLVFSEVAGFFPSGSLTTKPQYVYQGGFQYYPNDDVTLYFQIGAGLNEAADNFFVGGGFAVRNPKPWTLR